MTVRATVLLLGLLVAHYLGDFTPLARERVHEAKYGAASLLPFAEHAAIHGVLVTGTIFLLARPEWELLALAGGIEFVSHFLIDAGRAGLNARVRALRTPDRQAFWSALGADQLAHVAILVGLVALVL